VRVEFSPYASQDADDGRDWWLRHRDKAPDLFDEELEAAVKKLSQAPYAGEVVTTRGLKFEVRYVSMRKTRFRVFYRVNAEARLVEILRLWHMSRGETPSL